MVFACRNRTQYRDQCLLDTGAPLCVVPAFFHQTYDLDWQPLAGHWPAGFTTWAGVPCTIGRMDVWVPIPDAPFLAGPFSLIAKFAQGAPSSAAGALPILLGLNFLADYHAEVAFQFRTPPYDGLISLP